MKKAALIGVHFGWGAQIPATEFGPQALIDFELCQKLQQNGIDCYWRAQIVPAQVASHTFIPFIERMPFMQKSLEDLSFEVLHSLQANELPIVVGGDHTIAVGTWSGVVHALDAYQSFGLLWIDAHMDSHTPETSESHAPHGMPLASLLGYGDSAFTDLLGAEPKLKAEHVVLIGVRSFEQGEADLLKNLGVRIYTIEEVQQRSLKVVCEEALAQVSRAAGGFGISIDLDGFDPECAPGVGSPEPNGLDAADFMPCLRQIVHHEHFKVMEIVEFNPELDKDDKTISLIQELILQLKG